MICDKCDKEFDTSPNKINAGKRCPFCKNKTEALVYEFLSTRVASQVRYTNCFAIYFAR